MESGFQITDELVKLSNGFMPVCGDDSEINLDSRLVVCIEYLNLNVDIALVKR